MFPAPAPMLIRFGTFRRPVPLFKRYPRTGWEVEYLLNGAIGINDIVRLESGAARGYFRVHKVTLDGDNLEGDWICTAQLMEVASDSGTAPS